MEQQESIGNKTFRYILILAGAYILTNLALTFLKLLNKPFNPDELQHLHIAWLIAGGELLYKDFWEHHGPLYSLMNGALIFVADPEPSIRLLFAARIVSFAALIGILLFTGLIARMLTSSNVCGFIAAALLSSLFIVQNKGVEMRPDVLQNLFWVSGLFLIIRNQTDRLFSNAFWAGVLFALAILANAKAGVGPFLVVVFYLLAPLVVKVSWQDVWRDLTAMAIGGAMAVVPFLFYFLVTGTLADFLYYNFTWNVLLSIHWGADYTSFFADEEASLAMQILDLFLRHQVMFLVLVLTGTGLLLRKLASTTDAGFKRSGVLLLLLSTGTAIGWPANQWTQFFLIFLPLWSVLAAYTFSALPALLAFRKRAATTATATLAVVAGVSLLWYSVSSTPMTTAPLLQSQKNFTNWILNNTSRDEPFALMWNQCGGYMFNPHVGFYWIAMPLHSDIIAKISGEHPFDEAFIAEMDERNVRYVVGKESWMVEGLSPKALDWLRANFDYTDCLWERKSN
ncbi:MAG: glycosyltransferase family 39 protein [Gammaproteobacteria bacterium]|jgi:hypothetical protein